MRGHSAPHEKDGREDTILTCLENPEGAGEPVKARLHPEPRPGQAPRNLNNPLPLASGKLPLANPCSQAPTSAGNPGTCVRISDAYS
jgi:hypothetical protein